MAYEVNSEHCIISVDEDDNQCSLRLGSNIEIIKKIVNYKIKSEIGSCAKIFSEDEINKLVAPRAGLKSKRRSNKRSKRI